MRYPHDQEFCILHIQQLKQQQLHTSNPAKPTTHFLNNRHKFQEYEPMKLINYQLSGKNQE